MSSRRRGTGRSRADEKILLEWFDAIDIDRNGSVDAAEIRALLAANLVACSPARLEALFQAAGKRVDQELTMHDFVKVMHRGGAAALFLKEFTPVQKNGAKAAEKAKERAKEKAKPKAPALQRNSSSKSSVGTSGGGGGGLGSNRPSHESDDAYFIPGANGNGGYGNGGGYADGSSGNDKPPAIDDDEMRPLNEMRSDGDLAVLTYRRQRVLTDVRDPSKARRVRDARAFYPSTYRVRCPRIGSAGRPRRPNGPKRMRRRFSR